MSQKRIQLLPRRARTPRSGRLKPGLRRVTSVFPAARERRRAPSNTPQGVGHTNVPVPWESDDTGGRTPVSDLPLLALEPLGEAGNHRRSQSEASSAATASFRAWMNESRASMAFMKQLNKGFASTERAKARERRRIETRRRKATARKAERAKVKKPTPRPSKPSSRDLFEAAASGRFHDRFLFDATKTRKEGLRRIARKVGIPLKKLRHISNLLAGLQLQELVCRNSVTLPRLGQIPLVLSEPRRRVVNISGQIGRDGQQGLIESCVAAAPKFRPAASLRKALREAEEFDLISFPIRFKPRPVLSSQLQRSDKDFRSVRNPKVR